MRLKDRCARARGGGGAPVRTCTSSPARTVAARSAATAKTPRMSSTNRRSLAGWRLGACRQRSCRSRRMANGRIDGVGDVGDGVPCTQRCALATDACSIRRGAPAPTAATGRRLAQLVARVASLAISPRLRRPTPISDTPSQLSRPPCLCERLGKPSGACLGRPCAAARSGARQLLALHLVAVQALSSRVSTSPDQSKQEVFRAPPPRVPVRRP